MVIITTTPTLEGMPIKEYKGITSAAEYCKSIGTYDAIFGTNNAENR